MKCAGVPVATYSGIALDANVLPAMATYDEIYRTFGGTKGTGVTVKSSKSLTVTTPAHAAGAVAVVVKTSYGTSKAGSFTYTAPPSGGSANNNRSGSGSAVRNCPTDPAVCSSN